MRKSDLDVVAAEMNSRGIRIDEEALGRALSGSEENEEGNPIIGLWALKFLKRQIKEKLVSGKVFPTWKHSASVTGRWSVSKPCIHQFPSDHRSLVIPTDGKLFVTIDWKAADLTQLALYSKDEKMIAICMDSDDPYADLAPYLELTRDEAKIFVLMYLYGAGRYALRKALSALEKDKSYYRIIEGAIAGINLYFSEFSNKLSKLMDNKAVSVGNRNIGISAPYKAVSYYAQATVAENLNSVLCQLKDNEQFPILHYHDEVLVEVNDISEADIVADKMAVYGQIRKSVGIIWA